MNSRSKRLVAWLHLWPGLFLGLFFLIICLSGAVLVFEEQWGPVLYPSYYTHPVATKKMVPLPLDSLIACANKLNAGPLRQITILADYPEKSNLLLRTEGERLERVMFAINPYTGKLEKTIHGKHHVFSVAEELHRKLLLGKVGKTIVGITCIGYLLILLSGLILWWPKNKKILKQRLKIKWGALFKRLNWDLHAVGGFYILLLLIVMVLTGLTWSYDSIEESIFQIFDGQPEQKELLERGFKKEPKYANLYLNIVRQGKQMIKKQAPLIIELPRKKEDVIVMSYHDKKLYFDAYRGKLIKQVGPAKQSLGSKISNLMRPLHTGSIGGFTTQILYFTCTLFASVLPLSGLYIWLNKNKKRRNPKR